MDRLLCLKYKCSPQPGHSITSLVWIGAYVEDPGRHNGHDVNDILL